MPALSPLSHGGASRSRHSQVPARQQLEPSWLIARSTRERRCRAAACAAALPRDQPPGAAGAGSDRDTASTCTGASSASGAPAPCARFLDRGPAAGVPRIGLGLAALGRPGYINLRHGDDLDDEDGGSGGGGTPAGRDVDSMRRRCWRVLDEAWALGVRYFDAARSYGRAEEFLGGWLARRGIDPADVVVGSKWGYTYTAGWAVETGGAPHEVKEHSAANLGRQARETQQHLGQHLDLYQIHSATLESGVLQSHDVLQQLADLRDSRGWLMGLSVSGVQQGDVIDQALAIRTPAGLRLFSCVQATWNLMEQSAGPALRRAQAAGVAVIVKEALANGRLTRGNADPAFEAQLRLLQDAARQVGAGEDAVALACVLRQPWRPMVLSGAATPQQLRSNFEALRVAQQLPPEALAALQQTLLQAPQVYWDERARLAWN